LISGYSRHPEQVVVHDVIRAYLREQTQHRRGELSQALIDAHRSLRIWDSVIGTALHTFTGHTRQASALAVAPDGYWLASASDDGTVRIWDPVTGTALHTLTGHTDGVQALVAAPDGSWLASASGDGAVRIWDPVTGTTLHTRTGYTRQASTLQSPRRVLAGFYQWGASSLTGRCGSGTWPAARFAIRSPIIPARYGGFGLYHRHHPQAPCRQHSRGSGGGGCAGRVLAGLR
jgi:hypothetical protein